MASEVEEYRVAMRQQIAQLNRQIQLLDDRAADVAEDSREAYDSAVEEITQQRNDLEGTLVEMEVSSRAAWAELKVGLEQSWNDLSESVAAAARQYGIGDEPEMPGS